MQKEQSAQWLLARCLEPVLSFDIIKKEQNITKGSKLVRNDRNYLLRSDSRRHWQTREETHLLY